MRHSCSTVLLTVASMLFCPACKAPKLQQASPRAEKSATNTRYPRLGIPVVDGVADPSNTEIKLRRTSCFGWCPDYVLTLRGDGNGTYEGSAFVTLVGTAQFTVEPSTLLEILDRFEALNFLEMQPEEFPRIIDGAHEVLCLTVGGRSRQFVNAWIPPDLLQRGVSRNVIDLSAELSNLAALIGERVHVEQWIGTVEERRRLL